LRAFEVSARHLSFTRAADELNVTQTAISQHVKNLEERMGVPLFRRLPRVAGTDRRGPGAAAGAGGIFGRIGALLEQFRDGQFREVLTVGAVGTFAVGWLIPRLARVSSRRTPLSISACSPTTTASTWPARAWTTPYASATAPGTAPRPSPCWPSPLSPCVRPR
jgi:DNA-binding transcriptional LysR family regulator